MINCTVGSSTAEAVQLQLPAVQQYQLLLPRVQLIVHGPPIQQLGLSFHFVYKVVSLK